MKGDEAGQVQRWLAATGFSEVLVAGDGRLRAQGSGEEFDPADVEVPAAYRCAVEVGSEPRVMVFAIASSDGKPIGTLLARDDESMTPELRSVIDVLEARVEVPDAVCREAGHQHIAAVFPDRESAQVAVAELQEQGLGSDHLGLAVQGPGHAAFERDEEAVLGSEAVVGTVAGASLGALAGMALTALAIPGLAPLGIGGLFAVGAASGFGGAMLGGYLGIAAADEAFTAHGEIRETPLEPGEVLVTVLAHGDAATVESVMRRNRGALLTLKPSVP